jgi:hypothetical protein
MTKLHVTKLGKITMSIAILGGIFIYLDKPMETKKKIVVLQTNKVIKQEKSILKVVKKETVLVKKELSHPLPIIELEKVKKEIVAIKVEDKPKKEVLKILPIKNSATVIPYFTKSEVKCYKHQINNINSIKCMLSGISNKKETNYIVTWENPNNKIERTKDFIVKPNHNSFFDYRYVDGRMEGEWLISFTRGDKVYKTKYYLKK